VQKEAEKKLKYKSLNIEIQRMWNLKCTIVPVIIGATGIVTRRLWKNLETVQGKYSINSLQKTAILGTSHTIPKILQCEASKSERWGSPLVQGICGQYNDIYRDKHCNFTIVFCNSGGLQ